MKQITLVEISLGARVPRERFVVNGIKPGKTDGQEQAMGQHIRHQPTENWRSGDEGAAWLSTLIDTMETVSRREVRSSPCDSRLLSAVRLQLARRVSPGPDSKPELLRHRSPHPSARGLERFNP